MRIGVKYCGGCNERYDRVQAVTQLVQELPEHAFVPATGSEELIIVVSGCPIACAGHEVFADHKKLFAHSPEQLTMLAQLIKGKE